MADSAREIDWPAVAPAVATALLGDPSSRGPREWRWGRRGSFSLDLERGTWRDFEAGEGGGVLDLVMRERRLGTRAEALECLRAEGLVGGDRGAPWARPLPRRSAAPAAKPESDAGRAERERREERVAAIMAGSRICTGTPAMAYLAARRVWPPDGPAPNVFWIPRHIWPGDLPPRADGAAVFPITDRDGHVRGVHVEALDGGGGRVGWSPGDRYRRTFGRVSGGVYLAHRPPTHPRSVVIAEGPMDALACRWLRRDRYALCVAIVGVVSHAPLWICPEGVPVTIETDAGEAGRDQGNRLRDRLAILGRDVRLRHRTEGDPADELAAAVAAGGWERFLERGC